MRKLAHLTIILVILLCSFSSTSLQLEKTPEKEYVPSQSYTSRSPMVITSNADFVTEGWSGDGSPGNPYMIEWLEISSANDGYSLAIYNTTAHFRIWNCSFHYPILLNDTSYGEIQYSITQGFAHSIMVVNSYDIDLSYLILDGTCIVMDLSWDCTISRCTISSAPGDGVYLFDCSGNTIDACSITSSAATGIALEATATTTILNNLLQDNTDEEIFIYGDSMGNQIYYNQIYVGLEGVRDNGFSNTWDNGVSYGNWWSDYGGTGTYTIPGTAGSVDRYPRGPSSTDTTPPPLPTTTTPPANSTTTPGLGGVLIRSWTPMDLTIRVVLVLAIGMIYGALVVLFIKRFR